jgi:protein TonB
MLQDEIQPEHHLERSSPLALEPTPHEAEVQRKRMLIALGILLMAIAAVVIKDWDFWFPATTEVEEAAVRKIKNKSLPTPAPVPPAPSSHARKPVKAETPAVATDAPPMAATTQRAALPPLQVEVVAGNQHISIPAKSNAIHLDVGSDSASPSVSASAPSSGAVPSNAPTTTATNGQASSGNRVHLSQVTADNVTVSVPPNYPLLARQMKVQGAVSLQALISREGTIQELEILSGPAILAVAAREAVKQWHFKPYFQNGQSVETEARITVNFTISTN